MLYVLEIMSFITFVLFDIQLLFTAILILVFDLGMEFVSVLGLEADEPEFDGMKYPPLFRKERMLTKNLLGISYRKKW